LIVHINERTGLDTEKDVERIVMCRELDCEPASTVSIVSEHFEL